MRRVLLALVALVSAAAFLVVISPGPATAAVAARPAATRPVAATPATDPPITLPEGTNLTDCISAAPKPNCTTRKDTDWHQMAVFGVMFLGMAFLGWRVTRTVREARATQDALLTERDVPADR
ncbi:MAG: hypothetical protein R2715_12615 [Ilumatobacteraceae bacterium]